ncbi:MAG: MBOAT family O-acyltransferase [Steroidobacteraceae bacterium]
MLFNSYEFLFAFLPITLAVFHLLGRWSRIASLNWLILASLVFYAWWQPVNVPIIGVSMLVNFAIASWLEAAAADPDAGRQRSRSLVLAAGIVFNVAFLGYFKYTNFLLSVANDVAGTDFVLRQIALPLGISFITFQKIGFLIDVNSGRVRSFTLREYLLFVLFFPQLIAGPIVHYREMMPQFERATGRLDRATLAVGLTMIGIGLFKKVVLADGVAEFVTPAFVAASSGHVALVSAWTAALGFTLQIYFDFSGYSDMAAGLACCVGVRLPLNFYSPLQATSIIDFWSRWHVTLTRFLTAYLYNPMLLRMTRRRFARGLPGMSGRNTPVGAFVQLLALPTLLTMLVSGIWHGAGYVFALWGLLHGVYLVINHAWRLGVARYWPDRKAYARLMTPAGFLLTFIAVVVAMVLFRSPDVTTAGSIYRGMLGFGGVELPRLFIDRLAAHGLHFAQFTPAAGVSALQFLQPLLWISALLLIALLLPNSIQLLAPHQPVLDASQRPSNTGLARLRLQWNPTLPWAVVIAAMVVAAVMRMGGPSEFLYWQF